MRSETSRSPAKLSGTASAFAAYGIWGLFPLYWRLLTGVDALQILAHRLVWAAVFLLIFLATAGRLGELVAVARRKKTILVVALASAVMTFNWGLYIVAVNSGRVIESALGYYINPLISVALGALFFKEKIDRWTMLAVGLALAGIVAAGLVYGTVPFVSLALALSFAAYGAIKKRLHLEPMIGLALETLAMTPFALILLISRQVQGSGSFWNEGAATTIFLCLSGIVTAVPMLFFAHAANSISLQKLGFIQYLSPTGQLFVGIVLFGERPSPALLVAFAGVVAAVLIYVSTRTGTARIGAAGVGDGAANREERT